MGRRQLLPYFLVSGSMSLGYGSIYTLLADLRDRFGFSGTQLGLIVAAGFSSGRSSSRGCCSGSAAARSDRPFAGS